MSNLLITAAAYADGSYRGEVWSEDGVLFLGPTRPSCDEALEDALAFSRAEDDITVITGQARIRPEGELK